MVSYLSVRILLAPSSCTTMQEDHAHPWICGVPGYAKPLGDTPPNQEFNLGTQAAFGGRYSHHLIERYSKPLTQLQIAKGSGLCADLIGAGGGVAT